MRLAMQDLSVNYRPRRVLGSVGLNGSGKSSLIKAVAHIAQTFGAETEGLRCGDDAGCGCQRGQSKPFDFLKYYLFNSFKLNRNKHYSLIFYVLSMHKRFPIEQLSGLVLVLALHGAALFGLWSVRLIPSPEEAATIFVNFIAPPLLPKVEEPKRLPTPSKPPAIEKPQPRQLLAATPVTAPTDYVAPLPPAKTEPVQAPVMAAPIVQTPLAVGPVALSSELSVACPQRSAPAYPAISRRLGEMGVVVVQVELSETGHVTVAKVQTASGFDRLDEAALAAVRTWHCTPPTRNGQPVRATALQPFNFVIQGN